MRIVKEAWAQVTLPDYSGVPGWNLGPKPTLGVIVSKILPYVFVAAGLSMFVMLIVGGVELMLSGGDSGKVKAAQGKLTGGLIGFFLVIFAYFIAQIVEIMFGINILG
jgi:hypothetical protein